MLSAEVGEKPLKENPNGLFMIDVADLCEVEEGTPAPLSCHQVLHSPLHRVLIFPFLVAMPTHQEIMEGLRTLSEEVIESLRILFYMMFALTKVINPEEQVLDQEVTPIHRLIQEVKNQRQKIQDWIRSSQPSSRAQRTDPVDHHQSSETSVPTCGGLWKKR